MQTLKEYFKARLLQGLNENQKDEDKITYNPDGLRRAADEIERRWSMPTKGLDMGTGERIIKDSPMDTTNVENNILKLAAKRREIYDTNRDKLKDPLNLKNIGRAALDVATPPKPMGPDDYKVLQTYDELDDESIRRARRDWTGRYRPRS